MFVRHPRGVANLLLGITALSCVLAISEAQSQTKPAPSIEQSRKGAVDDKAIRALIGQLSDDVFMKREAAHKRLAEIGGPALGLLRKVAKESTDAEVRERATELIQRIQESGLHVVRVDFYHDFRNKGFPNVKFRTVGPDAAQGLKAEPEGLRVTLPTGKNKTVDALGLAAQFKVQGDFEITAGYGIIKVEQPKAGWGVSFELYLVTNTQTKEALAFDRLTRPDGAEVYRCSRMTTNNQGKREHLLLDDIPANEKAGRLRITRVGSKAVLSAADETGKKFRVLYRINLGTEELTMLRLAANPGGAANGVDLRIHDLRIRCAEADALKAIAGADKASP